MRHVEESDRLIEDKRISLLAFHGLNELVMIVILLHCRAELLGAVT